MTRSSRNQGSPADWSLTALAGLERQHSLLEALEALSREQRALIESGQAEHLLDLLHRRGRLVQELEAMEPEARRIADEWGSRVSALPDADRRRLERLAQDVAQAMERVVDRDGQDRAELERRRDEIARDLAGVGNSRSAVRAYARRARRRFSPPSLPGSGGLIVTDGSSRFTDAPGRALLRRAAQAAHIGADDLAQIVSAFNDAASRLHATHQQLQAEVVRLNRELRRANEELERSRRLAALGEMAAGIAHEVRNPLASIALYARLLREDLAAAPEQEALTSKILTAVRGLDAIVNDVLTFSREMRATARPVDASDLFAAALQASRAEIERFGPSLAVETVEPGRATVWCDPVLAQQAVVNLVRNALEAMGEAPPGRHVLGLGAIERRAAGTDSSEPATILSVRDSGTGLSPDVVARMFNPFFTTRATGTGLGLAIVNRIAEAHGGRVMVRNNSQTGRGGPGATVELVFPIIQQQTEGEEIDRTGASPAPVVVTRARVERAA